MAPDFLGLETAILQVDRDWAGLDDLLDDDFVITTAGWLSTPATKDICFEMHSVDVHDMGAVAVVLMVSTQSETWKDAPFVVGSDTRMSGAMSSAIVGGWR